VRVAASLLTRGNLSPGEREDRANRWVLVAFGVIGLLSAYLPAYTTASGSGPSMGTLCAIQAGHTLVTHGV